MAGRQLTGGFTGRLQTRFQAFMADWVLRGDSSVEALADTYLAPDFTALIDGKMLSRTVFQNRIARMRNDAIVEEQEFVEMMEEGDRLFSMHITRGVSRETGQPFQTRAIAFFVFEGERIKTGYLNSVTLGDPRDADFASRS
ncbi:MAG: nuclear transport factor 2 family protein [Pseudomonadota bacterium]